MKATIEDNDGMKMILEGDAVEVSTALATLKSHTLDLEMSEEDSESDEKWWEDVQYFSASHGWIDVTEMDTSHLVNAIAKTARFGAGTVMNPHRNLELNRDNLFALMENNQVRAMFCELATRIENGDD